MTSIPNNIQPAELGSPVEESGFQTSSNTEEVKPTKIDTAGEILDLNNGQHTEIDTAVSRASATENKAEISMLVCK